MRYSIENLYSVSEGKVRELMDEFARLWNAKYEYTVAAGKCAYRAIAGASSAELVLTVRGKRIDLDVRSDAPLSEIEILRHFLTRVGTYSENTSTSSLIELTDEQEIESLGAVMRRAIKPLRPIVYLSRLKYRLRAFGFDIDADRLARNLEGICDVVSCEIEYESILRRRSGNRNPEGGHVGIYYPDGSYNVMMEYRVSSVSSSAEDYVIGEIASYLTRAASVGFTTYESVLIADMSEKLQSHKNAEKRDTGTAKRSDTVELKLLRERARDLERECARLKQNLNSSTDVLLIRPPDEERRPCEYRDCVIAALEYRLRQCSSDSDRLRQVITSLLSVNERSDYEERMAHDISSKLKSGKISPNSFREWGISFIRQKKHMMFAWKNISFSIAVTPSDVCSAENQKSNIMRRLCVCN